MPPIRTPLASLGAALTLALAVTSCLPASLHDAVPDAIVVNAPYPERVPGAADGLQARLEAEETGVALAPSARPRFLESRSGLVGARAASGAADLARTTGADLAVGVSASLLERELDDERTPARERATLRLAVFVVAADGQVRARLQSATYRGERDLDEDALPPLANDALVAQLRDRALGELAPRVAAELRAAERAARAGSLFDTGGQSK